VRRIAGTSTASTTLNIPDLPLFTAPLVAVSPGRVCFVRLALAAPCGRFCDIVLASTEHDGSGELHEQEYRLRRDCACVRCRRCNRDDDADGAGHGKLHYPKLLTDVSMSKPRRAPAPVDRGDASMLHREGRGRATESRR
jgi:hypothetical protein